MANRSPPTGKSYYTDTRNRECGRAARETEEGAQRAGTRGVWFAAAVPG